MGSAAQINLFPGIFTTETPRSRFRDADYLAIMCHEIGTPLAAIIGLSHILSDPECTTQKKKECAEMLRNSSNMLMGLMKNILDSSRMEAGKVKIEHIDFDPAKVALEAVRIIAGKAFKKGLQLYVHIEDGFPAQYIGDPLRIRQILLNLLGNAIKFTEKGHIALYLDAKIDMNGNDQLCITVEDTGIGISPGQQKKIFDKYEQANSNISQNYGGSGLGLSISQDLAHLMYGEIAVKSWPDKGSHFIVTLPLQKTSEMLAVI